MIQLHFVLKQLKIGKSMGVLCLFARNYVNFANMESFCRDGHSYYGKNVWWCKILTNEVITKEIFDECCCIPFKRNSRTPSSKILTGKIMMMKLWFIKFVKNFPCQLFASYGILFKVALYKATFWTFLKV